LFINRKAFAGVETRILASRPGANLRQLASSRHIIDIDEPRQFRFDTARRLAVSNKYDFSNGQAALITAAWFPAHKENANKIAITDQTAVSRGRDPIWHNHCFIGTDIE
jgi:hypothetical protein